MLPRTLLSRFFAATAALLLALPLTEGLAVAQEAPSVPAKRTLTLYYTGLTGGLSSALVDYDELMPLVQPKYARDFEVSAFAQDNVFRHEGFLLFTPDGPLTLDDFQAFFEAGPVELQREGTLPLIATDYAYLWQPRAAQTPWLLDWLASTLKASGEYPDARAIEGTRYAVVNRQGLRLALISLTGEAPPADLLERPARWEMLGARTAVAGRGTGTQKASTALMAAGRPLGDGLRRAALLDAMRAAGPQSSLTVDLGNVLDPGFTELSRQKREFTFLQLGRMRYDALLPAETELSLPPTDWDRLRALVPMVAANLTPNAPTTPALPPYVIRLVGGLKVALIGAVDDQVLARDGATGPKAAWTATDPEAAVKDAVAKAALEKPDAIVLMTNVRDDRLQGFRLLPGLTAVLADFDGLPGETFSETANLSGISRLRTTNAYMIAHSSPNRVGKLEAVFEVPEGQKASLTQLHNEAVLVTDRLPYDEQWRWQLNLTLARYQADRRALLLPDLRDALPACAAFKPAERDSALPRIERHLWGRMVANVMRDATGAEVAIARLVPIRNTTLGPVNQLTVEGWLETGDRLVQTALPGKALKAIAAKDAGSRLLSFSGYDPANQKVNGYAIGDDELYLVTTTDQVARHVLYQDAFARRPVTERWLKHPSGWARPYAEGERTEQRELVLSYMKALKSRHNGAFDAGYMQDYAQLLADGDQVRAPRWTIGLEDGQLLFNSYVNSNTQAFDQVRNTRVNTPSSYAFGGKGRLSALYDAKNLAWENRAKAIYRRATLTKDGAEVTQETDDEVVLTSEARLKHFAYPLTEAMSLLPFVNTNFTTEFTPGLKDGLEKPRRAELNGIAGLSVNPGLGLKEIRLGAVLKNDLANPGMLEPGFQAIAVYEQKYSEAWPAVLRAGIDVTRYFATPTDTPDRLGLLADFTGGVTIPLWDHFNFTLSADYFLFRGKVPATDMLGTSLDVKVGLGYTFSFKPFYGVWF